MKNLHKADHELFIFVREVMTSYARSAGLALTSVSPMPKKRCRYYGECDHASGKIWIRVRKLVDGKWATQPDYPYQILDTVAHELAHLRNEKHDLEWFRLYANILSDLSFEAHFRVLRRMFKERKNT